MDIQETGVRRTVNGGGAGGTVTDRDAEQISMKMGKPFPSIIDSLNCSDH